MTKPKTETTTAAIINFYTFTPQVLSRHIGSFLNGDGGILCFGVRKTGVIYGDEISRKEEDNLKLIIDEIFKKMTPHVPTDTYRVTFTPVVGTSFRRGDGHKEATILQVLEIRVAPGDPFSLYEDQNHEVSKFLPRMIGAVTLGFSWNIALSVAFQHFKFT